MMGENRLISQSTFGHDARIFQGDVIANVKDSVNVTNHYGKSSGATDRRDGEDDVLRRLYTSPYEDRKDRNPPRVPGTCEWFTSHELFKDWQESTSSRLLWVSADPGCGKSVLARHLVDSILQTTESRTVCYFFFKDDYSDQRSVVSALCCILRQLFIQNPLLLSDEVLRQFAAGGETFYNSFAELWRILMQVSKEESAGGIICILDAIDECEDQASQLAQELCKLYGAANDSCLKFLLTSRPYGKIHRHFQPLEMPELPVIHLSGESENEMRKISQEIDIFIQSKVEHLGKQLKLLQDEQNLLLQELMKISHRTYLWVSLTLDLIERDLNLDRTISDAASCIPGTVEGAYERILSKSCDFEQARKILHIVVAATRPLTLEEMNLALALRESHRSNYDIKLSPEERFRQQLRDICGFFITIIDSKIYLLHQTAKEFLLNDDGSPALDVSGRSTWKRSFDLSESHHILFDICILYLGNLGSDANRTNASRLCANDGTFLDYSANHWVTHYHGLRTETQKEKTQLISKICDIDSRQCQIWLKTYWQSTNTEFPKGFTSLMVTAYFGLQTAFQSLTKADIDLNAQDETYQRSALTWAVRNGSNAVAELLIKGVRFKQGPIKLPWRKKAKVNQLDKFGRTPLFYAVWNGDVATVELLINAGAIVHLKDHLDGTPISYAICKQHEQVVDLLLRTGDAVKVEDDINNLFSTAAGRGHDEVVELLLKTSRVDPNAPGPKTRTPLLYAVKGGHVDTMKTLLSQGADPNYEDRFGWTPLLNAVDNGNVAILKILLEGGANPNQEDHFGQTPLIYAVERGDKVIKKEPVGTGAWMIYKPVLHAATDSQEAMVRALLEGGADPNQKNKAGHTPLTYAANHGNVAIVKILLEGRASADPIPLLCAVKYGQEAVVKALLERGADPNHEDGSGRAPISHAAERGHAAMVKILLEGGADPNHEDVHHRKPVFYATKCGHALVETLLLEASASPRAVFTRGEDEIAMEIVV
ncbi:ankyrin repeat-containing domain protein [Trichoderma austrokoningii]